MAGFTQPDRVLTVFNRPRSLLAQGPSLSNVIGQSQARSNSELWTRELGCRKMSWSQQGCGATRTVLREGLALGSLS